MPHRRAPDEIAAGMDGRFGVVVAGLTKDSKWWLQNDHHAESFVLHRRTTTITCPRRLTVGVVRVRHRDYPWDMTTATGLETVLTFREALERVTRARLRTLVKRNIWRCPYRGVFVTHNGPLLPVERDAVALLVCATGSVLGGLSSLRHDGFSGHEVDAPVVVQPAGADTPPYDDVRLRWSTMLDERDVHPERKPRRTRPARSLVDAASWASADVGARQLVIAGVQQGLVRTSDLREALTRRGTCHRRALIVQSILDASGGIQSLPERDFEELRLRARLPRPTRQSPKRRPDGRYYLDVSWDEFDAAVEIHGIPHLEVPRWEDDLSRANEIVIGGTRLLIFSSFAVRHHGERVINQVVRLLVARGWRPHEGFGLVVA